MTAYACGSGGVMFVPEEIERTLPIVAIRRSNDNDQQGSAEQNIDKKGLADSGRGQYDSLIKKDLTG